jgi:imidazolonepropionase-like amidohydrolase
MALPTGSATPPFNGLGCVLRLNEGPQIVDRADAVEVAEVGGMTAPKSGGSRAAQWMLLRSALSAAQQAKRSDEPGPLLSAQNLNALAPVLAQKIPLAILASRESDLRQAVALAGEYKIRVVLIGAEEGWRVADLLAVHKIPVVLDPYASGPSTYDAIGSRLDNAAILDRAGVVVSFRASFVHVSYNAGIALREGAGIAVANGLPWAHALRALTSGAAETWGIEDHYGTLAPGQDADVVLWDGDPLEPTSAPALVLVRGQQVSLVTRQNELEQRYSPRHAGDPLPPAFRE